MKEIPAANTNDLCSIINELKDPNHAKEHVKIGWLGSRRLVHEKFKEGVSLNDLYASAVKLIKDEKDPDKARELWLKLIELDIFADKELAKTKFVKYLHFIPQGFGKIGFNRYVAGAALLNKIEELEKKQAIDLNGNVKVEDFSIEDRKKLKNDLVILQKWYQKVEDGKAKNKPFSDTEESRDPKTRDEIVNAFMGIKKILQRKCLGQKEGDFAKEDLDIQEMYNALSEITKHGKERLRASSVFVMGLTADSVSKEACAYFKKNCPKFLVQIESSLK